MNKMLRESWEHLTSWWLYPVIAAITVILLVLAGARIQDDLIMILFRLTVVASALAFAYDHGCRRRRLHRRSGNAHESPHEPAPPRWDR